MISNVEDQLAQRLADRFTYASAAAIQLADEDEYLESTNVPNQSQEFVPASPVSQEATALNIEEASEDDEIEETDPYIAQTTSSNLKIYQDILKGLETATEEEKKSKDVPEDKTIAQPITSNDSASGMNGWAIGGLVAIGAVGAYVGFDALQDFTTTGVFTGQSVLKGTETEKSLITTLTGSRGTGISSYFGRRMHPVKHVIEDHSGLDVTVPIGSPIYAPFDGQVVKVIDIKNKGDENNPNGNALWLVSDDGRQQFAFAHLSQLNLPVGAKVIRGSVVALSGNTGRSTGPHLHVSYYERSEAKGAWIQKDPLTASQFKPNPSSDTKYLPLTDGALDASKSTFAAFGERANNPFNFKDFGQNWYGETGETIKTPAGEFLVFKDKASGLRAGQLLLHNYGKKGINTINSFVDTFVTTADNNDTREYKQYLTSTLGIGAEDKIDLTDSATRIRFGQAVIRKETGSRVTLADLAVADSYIFESEPQMSDVFSNTTSSSSNWWNSQTGNLYTVPALANRQ